MQPLLTAEAMRRVDRAAIERWRIPALLLMENAGRAFVDALSTRTGDLRGRRALVVCGKGNNGGDGFVIARHLAARGWKVHVVLLARRSEVGGEARSNLDTLRALASSPRSGIAVAENPRRFVPSGSPDLIVDAVFGTGFTGKARGPAERAIRWINRQDAFVVSVDIPSGVNATDGTIGSVAVRARLTITMAAAKIGHYVGDGREHSGEVLPVDIGIPEFVMAAEDPPAHRVERSDVRAVIPHRPLRAHKYSAGKVYLLAGSRGFTGAPAMAALAAMRSGAGAVVLGIPRSIHAVLARKLTEVILHPLPETEEGGISPDGLEEIMERVRWADVVAMGPGLGLAAPVRDVVHTLVRRVNRPLVIDADALSAIGTGSQLLRRRKNPTILTPHTGELARMIGSDAGMIERGRVEAARTAAASSGCILVLKGAPTVTASPGGRVVLNSTGNPGMATIGSGDVLTGVVAGLLARGMEPLAAAWSGVFLHGLAGDRAALRLGEASVMAMDILAEIPSALQSL